MCMCSVANLHVLSGICSSSPVVRFSLKLDSQGNKVIMENKQI